MVLSQQTSGYNSVTNSCNLRLSEKLVIYNFRDKKTFNKQTYEFSF